MIAPDESIAELHNRMPAVLAPEAWPTWLGEEQPDPPQLKSLLAPYPSEAMTCWPVSPRVGSVKNNDPSLISRSPVWVMTTDAMSSTMTETSGNATGMAQGNRGNPMGSLEEFEGDLWGRLEKAVRNQETIAVSLPKAQSRANPVSGKIQGNSSILGSDIRISHRKHE